MLDRRTLLAAAAMLPVAGKMAVGKMAVAQTAQSSASGLLTIAIARTGQQVPIVGLGTARRYEDPKGEADLAPLRATIKRFVDLGGVVIDTAPPYGRAEEVLGQLIAELGVRDKLFLCTKVSVNDRAAGQRQIEQSFKNLRTNVIDLLAVHNLRDLDAELAALRDLKAKGRIRSLGITTSFHNQYADFEAVMQKEPLDCIQVDYAIDNRTSAERLIPLAQDKGMSVMVNLPFGRERLFGAVAGKPLPDWAKEIGATSWAQIFLKYVVSHPARPIPVPGMAQAKYVDDNLGAARAPLPDAALRRRMEQFIDAL